MLEVNKIYNMDCLEGMKMMEDNSVDIVLSSPPYNTARNGNERAIKNYERRYDVYMEKRSNQEYQEWMIKIFEQFNRLLKENGCILWNMSYGGENPMLMYDTLNSVCSNTPFMIADTIVWKKKSALPNNVSPNKLTRICEFVFVLCRTKEYKTFNTNKKVKTVGKTGQMFYENVFNFIEAKNNDGSNPYNKATFSTDLVKQLLEMYSKNQTDIILDPFMGIGTTALGCIETGRNYIGFEISENQCNYFEEKKWDDDL